MAKNKISEVISIKDYAETLSFLKKRIQKAQIKAAISINSELISLYWDIGMIIAEKQEKHSWGSSIIENLARDLQNAFPGIGGFSRRNVFRMRAFYQAYEKVPQAVALLGDLPVFCIPWGHNALILEKVKNTEERLWYAQKIIEQGWTRSELEDWIESDVYSREGKAVTNFSTKLPKDQAKVAQEMLRDPYNFDYLLLRAGFHEKETELDNPSIGLILCKKKSKFVAEYALRHINNLMAVSGYTVEIMKKLPKELSSSFPTTKEIEAELEKDI